MTARVGNYVTDNPSNLGNYVTADKRTVAAAKGCPVRVKVVEFGVSLRGWLRSSDIGCGF